MTSKIAAAMLSASLVSACTVSEIAPNTDNRPIPIEAIINQMKCEIALAMTKIDRKRLDFTGWYIDGKLKAKTITNDTSSASLGTGDKLIPLGSKFSGGFNLSNDVVVSRTLDQVGDFVISPYANDASICEKKRAPTVRMVNGLGIYSWLHKLTSPEAGDPKITWTNLSYVLDFGVKRTGNGGVDVSVIGIKASASATVVRDDINQLTLTFSPGEAIVKKLKEEIRRRPANGPIVIDGAVFVPFNQSGGGLLLNDETMTQMLNKRVLVEK